MTLTNHCLHLLVLELVVKALSHVASNLKSIMMSVKAMARYLPIEGNFREYLKQITLEDHRMALEVFIPEFCECSISVLYEIL